MQSVIIASVLKLAWQVMVWGNFARFCGSTTTPCYLPRYRSCNMITNVVVHRSLFFISSCIQLHWVTLASFVHSRCHGLSPVSLQIWHLTRRHLQSLALSRTCLGHCRLHTRQFVHVMQVCGVVKRKCSFTLPLMTSLPKDNLYSGNGYPQLWPGVSLFGRLAYMKSDTWARDTKDCYCDAYC